jgi:hypothetical protein
MKITYLLRLFRGEKIESCVSPERGVRTFNNDTSEISGERVSVAGVEV